MREFLHKVVTDCGMSVRPEFYSGRGATTADLDSQKLERIWAAIQTHLGEDAAQGFVDMVVDLPCLSATDFLLALERLDFGGWRWNKNKRGNERGIYPADEMSAWATLGSVLFGSNVDQTDEIRRPFLLARGVDLPPVLIGIDGYRWGRYGSRPATSACRPQEEVQDNDSAAIRPPRRTRRQARRKARRLRYNQHRSAWSGTALTGAVLRRHPLTWTAHVDRNVPVSRWYRRHIGPAVEPTSAARSYPYFH